MTAAELADLRNSLPGDVPPALSSRQTVVVTGCGGFLGSHLTEFLLGLGCRVVGVDALTDYYDPGLKRLNLARFLSHPRFTFHHADLLELDAEQLLDGASVCFHLAAQAGVRASWGRSFDEYLTRNVLTTQHLLEGCGAPAVQRHLHRFVYASSSSIYGNQTRLPVREDALPRPHSPYGVTKLAGEHLCALYARNRDVPVSCLRYFTIYGPRQRPDMAFTKFLNAAIAGRAFAVYGDGRQTRDFTYVADAVRATILAVAPANRCEVFNVGGGARVSLRETLELLEQLTRKAWPDLAPAIEYGDSVAGDVRDTFADCTHAQTVIDYRPTVDLSTGLTRQLEWMRAERQSHG